MRQLFEAAVSWSYDSPAKGGLHHAHYPGRVANRMDLLKWTSRAAAPVFAIMLCGSNSTRAAASQSQIPCAGSFGCQRIHVILNKHDDKLDGLEEICFMEKLITRKEAAEILGISIATLDAARNNGLISYVQYVQNGCVYFTSAGLQEYIAKCTHRAKPAEKNATYRKPRRAGV